MTTTVTSETFVAERESDMMPSISQHFVYYIDVTLNWHFSKITIL